MSRECDAAQAGSATADGACATPRQAIDSVGATVRRASSLRCSWRSALCAARRRAAQAQIAFAPCGDSNDFACGHLTVPLDPSGGTPGTITLAIRRHRAPVGEARSAIIALAGGPGQAGAPVRRTVRQLLGPIVATRDLIVFDQRGIGLSAPLSCHAFEPPQPTTRPARDRSRMRRSSADAQLLHDRRHRRRHRGDPRGRRL
jgi:hypothetical protein